MDLKKWRERAERLKIETYALYLSYRDPRVPFGAKLLAVVVIGLSFSPIDLIPDFIPVLGHLDDLVVALLGVALVIKMIPDEVLAQNRQKAIEMQERGETPVSRTAGVIIIILWIIIAVSVALFMVRLIWN